MVPPLFRKIDWLTFTVTTVLVFIGYWWTLAPDLTLEDSGELSVASMYCGVPHPPGYPVWSIYTWLFQLLVPVSNIAYRVALSSAVAGAFACGLVALMVSRGCSMMVEGIAELKNMDRRWENALCFVSGFVAGMVIGFNGFMWSQAVIVEVYTLSVLSLAGVLVCLLRWIYAPHQMRYLYLAFFWFGITFNNHQSLLVVALGLEVAIAFVRPKLGRDLLFWNWLIWIGGLVLKSMGKMTVLQDNFPLLAIYWIIGVGSLIAWIILVFITKKSGPELARDFAFVGTVGYFLLLFGHITSYVTVFDFKTGLFAFVNLLGLACTGAFIYLVMTTTRLGKEWRAALICGGAWVVGAAFYLYMPLASMSNPPLNWGYPRTVTGFFHAFTRGQYERIHPTTSLGRAVEQIGMYVSGALEEFNLVYLLMAILPLLFIKRMQPRERNWLIGLTAIYFCLSVFLLILLNPSPDRQSRELNRVFFAASHMVIAMGVGYGLTLVGGFLATQYGKFRPWVLKGLLVACGIALLGVLGTFFHIQTTLVHAMDRLAADAGIFGWIFGLLSWFFSLIPNYSEDTLVRFTVIFGLLLAIAATLVIWLFKERLHLGTLLAICAAMPLYPIFVHWADNEQRGHLYGYWFGHDMFTPPFTGPDGKLTYDKKLREEMLKKPEGKLIYPEMDAHTVLYGGTDPGRFNPTYMIFCESFISPEKKPHDSVFDRRDVYLITQNALADGTYLSYIRAHYNRSAQIDPPFFQELLRGPRELEQNYKTNIFARAAGVVDRVFLKLGDNIEKKRRAGTSYFKEQDFIDLPSFAAKLRPGPQQDKLSKYLYDRLSKETQALLGQSGKESALRSALAKDLNELLENEYRERRQMEADIDEIDRRAIDAGEKERLKKERAEKYRAAQHQLYEPDRFEGIKLSDHVQKFIQQSPYGHSLIRLNRLLLEEAYPKEIAKSPGGVYPDREILTGSNEDSQRAFQEYLANAQQRLDHDRKFPNEPRQIKPGEDVKIIDNRVQVSGQVAVMAINGLLTKIIFDKNPGHEFYVEESFPLDWMFPHLTPYGIIMKINRDPVPEITQDMVDRDHHFWSKFSERLVGNWITYDTTVADICAFADKTYYRHDYPGFKGDPKFVRDNDGQKAFSKLRSSIAGIYNFRIGDAAAKMQASPLEGARWSAVQQRMLKEAEFAFKQAYAFCPYSPEAVFRYINLLISLGRVDDARLIAVTSLKLDPYNPQMANLVNELNRIKAQQASIGQTPPPVATPPNTAQVRTEMAALEKQLAADPGNVQAAYKLLGHCVQAQETNRALQLMDQLLANPKADGNTMLFVAEICRQWSQFPRVEQALARLVKVSPDHPEAWFDLGGFQAVLNKNAEAIASLRKALQLSAARRARDSNAVDLMAYASNDPRLNALRSTAEFQKLLGELKTVAK